MQCGRLLVLGHVFQRSSTLSSTQLLEPLKPVRPRGAGHIADQIAAECRALGQATMDGEWKMDKHEKGHPKRVHLRNQY
ncbi:hypothetical protein H4582DRAFT_1966267 [Lactarius indigo]|nr:hypothetical protein H4582DRAFT_1966267 [Lactarius indigo]